MNGKRKICLISSHGGHLRELLAATENVREKKYIVTHRAIHAEEILAGVKHYFILDPHLSFFKFAVNFFQSLKHILREKPDVIVSTGAGIVIPSILLGKYLLKSKLIFIESAANVVNPSRTGRFLYSRADLFLIQWPEMARYYPRAVYCGLV
ncbi:MAG: polysaccharide biosynthesis protein [Candidatus Aminicenantes bacterium]|nr:polysaccharide biosynthesis protein [Candidatus Aminicenantes bacterium]